MKKEGPDEEFNMFDMEDLRISLPQKRGLSRYYAEKSRSYKFLGDAHTLEDLKKQDHEPDKKRMKNMAPPPPLQTVVLPSAPSCRIVSTTNHRSSSPCIGV